MMRCSKLTTLVVVCAAQAAMGANKAKNAVDTPEAQVDRVLRDEVVSGIDRRRALAKALSLEPNSDLIRWQSGFVRDGKRWRSFDQTLSPTRQALLADYRERRERAELIPTDQLALANWCHQQGLPEQERVHLCAVVKLSPEQDQSAIYERLGYWRVGNQWLNQEQLQEWADVNKRAVASIKHWGPALEKIIVQLQGSRRQRETALAALDRMDDPESVPALEYVLCGRDASLAEHAVNVMSRIDAFESTIALAKQAVFSQWSGVRKSAAGVLQKRPLEDFVPNLIALLATPAEGRVAMQPRLPRRGRGLVLFYSYVIARETQDQFQAVVLNTVDYRLNEALRGVSGTIEIRPKRRTLNVRLNFDPTVAAARNAIDMQRDDAALSYLRDKQLTALNDRTAELNSRIIDTLATVSAQSTDADVRTWWKWWRDYTDTERVGEKQIVRVDENQVLGDATYVPDMQYNICSCFASGTPVWTESGKVTIEEIQPGDCVLAKDALTGELAYKPVLATSVRKPRDLVHVRFGDETICATSGHRFWVSGDGWTKARDLKPDALVHTATGNCTVSSVAQGTAAKTYNLVVDDFHSYFVGSSALLVQDLPLPKSTNNVVPGLPRQQAAAKAKP